jgi:hypothetical protein
MIGNDEKKKKKKKKKVYTSSLKIPPTPDKPRSTWGLTFLTFKKKKT